MLKGFRLSLQSFGPSFPILLLSLMLLVPVLVMGQTAPAQNPAKPAAVTTPPATTQAPARKPPQAKTQVEYDAYQKIVATTDPKEKMALVDAFVTNFPDSELKGVAYEQALSAAQTTNDYEKSVDYSRKVLAAYPDNVMALLILSSWIPERTNDADPQRDAKLTEATNAANKLLAVIPTLQKPATESADQWKAQTDELNGRPLAALGFIKLQQKDYPGAEQEFEKAISYMPTEPTFYYRLGLAYTYEKKYDQAAWNLARSVALKGVSEKPAHDALDALFKAYGEDPAKAGEDDLITMAGSQDKFPPDFSFTKFMESKLTAPKPPSGS